ncbi:glutathione S-transferase family protein [Thalassobaculum sp.]|uniref:glutathione S-transferase family protein n=1 Tax=Thalassobaculum sp. TaxID=2022740 RepID=UPI0032F07944
MKLFYTPNSPYARICRIVALEGGLGDALELVRVPLRTPDSPSLKHGPLGKIPLLVDGDLALGESRLICGYLDQRGDGPPSLPGASDWQAHARESLMSGFLEGITNWSREKRRDPTEQSAFILEVEEQRAIRAFEFIERTIPAPPAVPPITYGDLALVAALGMVDFYELVPDWRGAYPALAAWLAAYEALPSVRDSVPTMAAMNPLTR